MIWKAGKDYGRYVTSKSLESPVIQSQMEKCAYRYHHKCAGTLNRVYWLTRGADEWPGASKCEKENRSVNQSTKARCKEQRMKQTHVLKSLGLFV